MGLCCCQLCPRVFKRGVLLGSSGKLDRLRGQYEKLHQEEDPGTSDEEGSDEESCWRRHWNHAAAHDDDGEHDELSRERQRRPKWEVTKELGDAGHRRWLVPHPRSRTHFLWVYLMAYSLVLLASCIFVLVFSPLTLRRLQRPPGVSLLSCQQGRWSAPPGQISVAQEYCCQAYDVACDSTYITWQRFAEIQGMIFAAAAAMCIISFLVQRYVYKALLEHIEAQEELLLHGIKIYFSAIHVEPFWGKIFVENLIIGNPPGFSKNRPMVQIGHIAINLGVASLLWSCGRRIVVESLLLAEISAFFESGGMGSNAAEAVKIIERAQRSLKEAERSLAAKGPTELEESLDLEAAAKAKAEEASAEVMAIFPTKPKWLEAKAEPYRGPHHKAKSQKVQREVILRQVWVHELACEWRLNWKVVSASRRWTFPDFRCKDYAEEYSFKTMDQLIGRLFQHLRKACKKKPPGQDGEPDEDAPFVHKEAEPLKWFLPRQGKPAPLWLQQVHVPRWMRR